MTSSALSEEVCSLTRNQAKDRFSLLMHTCQALADSKDCKNLKEQLTKSEQPEDAKKIISCKREDVLAQDSSLSKSWSMAKGCGIGLFDSTFGNLGRAIGEGIAKWQIDREKDREKNKECSKSLENKKAFFKLYNSAAPRLVKVEVPSDEVLNKNSCKSIQEDLLPRSIQAKYIRANASINSKKAKDYTPEEKELLEFNKIKLSQAKQSSVLASAKKLIEDQGIKLWCYSTQAQSAMMCEAIGTVLSLAIPGAQAARIANLRRLAGLKAEAQGMKTLSAENKAEILTRNASLTSEQRVQKAAETLRRNLNKNEQEAIIAAHKVGESSGHGYGTYTRAELLEKEKILREAGFKSEEISLMMRKGITGEYDDLLKTASQKSIDRQIAEDKLRVKITSDEVQLTKLQKQLDNNNLTDAQRTDIENKISVLKSRIDTDRSKLFDAIGPGLGPVDAERLNRHVQNITRNIEIAQTDSISTAKLMQSRAKAFKEVAEFTAANKNLNQAREAYGMAAKDIAEAVKGGSIKTYNDKVQALKILQNAKRDDALEEVYRNLIHDIAQSPQITNHVVKPSTMTFDTPSLNSAVVTQQKNTAWEKLRELNEQNLRIEIQRSRNEITAGHNWESHPRLNREFDEMIQKRDQIEAELQKIGAKEFGSKAQSQIKALTSQ